ncbi:DUF2065 family protein [Tropicimonas sediminicola]|uniref:DUF2065 domain-containing protein n=1 Tax=Tropicimonas sediminicola TaxID=1031541 RepID=A0A239CVP1_9RHOB|nr:hypothetical protein SAMN05421757_101508 [Tropicimonas sediminicola]
MIAILILAFGLVLVLEGLVLALAPSRMEEVLRMLVEMPVETRRLIGLLAMTLGGILLWLAAWVSG